METSLTIAGGGLAGLSLAILCAQSGLKVTVLEKGSYPRNKVCGEYISMESYNFLIKLGVPIKDLNLPIISNFVLTSHHGTKATCRLDPGGFGISRLSLDNLLSEIAVNKGVSLLTNTKISKIDRIDNLYEITSSHDKKIHSDLFVSAIGRNNVNNEDLKVSGKEFIGVKYHVKDGPPIDTIEIHHFEGGYCGISKVDHDLYCLCYLVQSSKLKSYGSIESMEGELLTKNKFLRDRISTKKVGERMTTSQINFGLSNNGNNYLSVGDSSGFIPPLTGNGMSLAFRSAKELHNIIIQYRSHRNYETLLTKNNDYINQYLNHRIKKGIILQNILFEQGSFVNKSIFWGINYIPGLLKSLSHNAVGKEI
jgi:menaquinone-9 beta-reductase